VKYSAHENKGFTTLTRAEHSTLQKSTSTEDSIQKKTPLMPAQHSSWPEKYNFRLFSGKCLKLWPMAWYWHNLCLLYRLQEHFPVLVAVIPLHMHTHISWFPCRNTTPKMSTSKWISVTSTGKRRWRILVNWEMRT